MPDARERVYQRAFERIFDESRRSGDYAPGEAAFRLGLMFGDRPEVFEWLVFAAGRHRKGQARADLLRVLFSRWPDHPQVHALLKTAAAESRDKDQLFAIRMLAVAYPSDPETLVILKGVAEGRASDESASAAFSECLRLQGYRPDVLEWAIDLLRYSADDGALVREGPLHLFRCYGPRKALLHALLELGEETTTNLVLLRSVVAALRRWAPEASANLVTSRIPNAHDEKTQLRLLDMLIGRSEAHISARLRFCEISPFLSVRLKSFTSSSCGQSFQEIVPLGLRLIEDDPLSAGEVAESIAGYPENKDSVAAKLAESYQKLASVDATPLQIVVAKRKITGSLSTSCSETSAALEHFKVVVLKTSNEDERYDCLMGLSTWYQKDAITRATIDQYIHSERLERPDGLLSRIAKTFSEPSDYLRSVACGDFPLSVRLAAIRALVEYEEPGIQLLMHFVGCGPSELRDPSLNTLKEFVRTKGWYYGGRKYFPALKKFLAKHGCSPE